MILNSLALWGKSLFYIFLGAFGITFLVTIHEFGHYLFCKIFGIKTPSFSIGFGPRLIEKKIGDTVFALSAIPLGGYVEIAGSQEVGQGEQADAKSKESWSFSQKPYWQQLLVMSGGILFNLIFAYIACSAIFYVGVPKTRLLATKNVVPTISQIVNDSPAAKAQLQVDDKILKINDISVSQEVGKDINKLLEYIQTHPNQKVIFTVKRDSETIEIPVEIESKKIGKQDIGFLGTDFERIELPGKKFGDAIKEGIETTNSLIKRTFQAFGNLFTRDGIKQVGGPLMIGWELTKSAESSLLIFLLLLAFISINLAVLNVFPLPILDGGQILFYTIEALMGRQLPEKVRVTIHYMCWILAMVLFAFIFIKDLLSLGVVKNLIQYSKMVFVK